MPKDEQTLFTSITAAYFTVINKLNVSLKRGLIGKKGYACNGSLYCI